MTILIWMENNSEKARSVYEKSIRGKPPFTVEPLLVDSRLAGQVDREASKEDRSTRRSTRNLHNLFLWQLSGLYLQINCRHGCLRHPLSRSQYAFIVDGPAMKSVFRARNVGKTRRFATKISDITRTLISCIDNGSGVRSKPSALEKSANGN